MNMALDTLKRLSTKEKVLAVLAVGGSLLNVAAASPAFTALGVAGLVIVAWVLWCRVRAIRRGVDGAV